MKPISKEEALSDGKPRGRYYEVARKYVSDFKKWHEEKDVDAAAIYFHEFNPFPPESVYKSIAYIAKKEGLPIKVSINSLKERVTLFWDEE